MVDALFPECALNASDPTHLNLPGSGHPDLHVILYIPIEEFRETNAHDSVLPQHQIPPLLQTPLCHELRGVLAGGALNGGNQGGNYIL